MTDSSRHAFHGSNQLDQRRPNSKPAIAIVVAALLVFFGLPAAFAQTEVDGPILIVGELRADDWTPIAGQVELVPGLTNHGAADLFEKKALGRSPRPLATASSRVDGTFELIAPGPGVYWIQAKAPGYATVQRNLQFLGASRRIEPLRLPASMVRTFRIEDSEGKPIEDATLRVALGRERGKPSDAVTSAVGRSNAQGQVQLELAMGDRSAQVDITAPGFVPGANRGISADDLKDDWSTITLVRGQARSLRVTVDGEPYGGAVILLEGGRLPVARSDETGRATVWAPTAATVRSPMPMVAEADGVHLHFGVAYLGDGPARPTGPGAETIALTNRTQTVRGTVVDTQDQPVANAWLWTARPLSDPVRSNAEGRFSISIAAQYPTEDHKTQIGVAHPGVETQFVDLGRHQRIVVDRSQGGVPIRVTDIDGAPVGAVRITASPTITQPGQVRRFAGKGLPVAVTNQAGRATLQLPAEDLAFRIAARKPGYQHWDDVLPPAPSNPTETRVLEIELQPGTVHVGWVVDDSDVGIAGANVEIHRPDPQPQHQLMYSMAQDRSTLVASVVTDGDGRFEIRDVPSQKVRLEARAAGFGPTEVAGVDILEQNSEIGTVVLAPGHELAGVVMDDEGEPIPGVTVEVERATNRMVSWQPTRDQGAVTDAQGKFAKSDLAAGRYSIWVRQEGFREVREQIEIPLDEELELRLLRGITIPVRLTDGGGEPLEFGWLNWHESSPPRLNGRYDGISGHTRSQDGSAEIFGLRPGTFAVNVSGQNQTPLDFELVIESGGRARVDHERVQTDGRSLEIRFAEGVSLRGTVRGPGGEPVTDLQLLRGGGSARIQGSEYSFSGLEPGLFEVTFKVPGYVPHDAKIEIGNLDQVYDVTLEEGWTLEGTVVDRNSGQPLAAAMVRLGSLTESLWTRDQDTVMTDASGRFELTGIAAGQFAASATAEGYAESRVSPLDIDGPPSPLTFELTQGARIYGVVTGRDDQLTGMRIGLHFNTRQSYTTEPAFDGTYEFRHVPAGVAQLSAGHELAGPYLVQIEVPEDGELEHDIELGTNRLTGLVLLGGEPYAGADVGAMAEGQLFGGASTQTGPDGRFELNGLADGPTHVIVSRNNMPLSRQTVEVFDEVDVTIDIQLLRLSGRVLSAQGGPVAGARVGATTAASSLLDLRGGSATTNATGRFVLELPADSESFELTASAAGHPPAKSTWSTGEPTEIELTLPPSGGALEIQWTGSSPMFDQILVTDTTGQIVQSGFGAQSQAWRIEDVPPGDWTVWVQSGLAVVSQPVRVLADPEQSGTVVPLSWPTTGKVLLRAHMAGMDWTGRTRLRLLDGTGAEPQRPRGPGARNNYTSYSQLYSGQPVDALVGTWTLEKLDGDQVLASTTFTVVAGRVTEISLDP